MSTDPLNVGATRRWPFPAALGAVTGAAVAATVLFLVVDDESDNTESETDPLVELVTVAVEQRDLLSYSTIGASIGFERTVEVPITRDGIVTWVAGSGTVIDLGDVVIEVDGEPVVALRGWAPTWRDLEEDVDPGVDVRQLEENLVALGFTADGEMVVDDEFDAETTEAVEAWQESLGVEPDGIVEVADIVVLPGPAELGDPAVVSGDSARAGDPLATATVLSLSQTIVQRAEGVLFGLVTEVAASATPVVDGTVLYAIDGRPVVAVVEAESAPAVTFDREITDGIDPGDDVQVMESFLVRLGFDAGGTLTVGRDVDLATLVAIADWQESLGITPEEIPVVRVGDVVVVRGERSVSELFLVPGQLAPISIPAVSVTRSVRVVTGELPVADLDLLVVGQRVDIELPDETVLSGTVREVGDVARTGAGQNSDAVVDFLIEADDDPDQSQLVVAPVTVRVLEDEIRGAIAIPVPSLIAVVEGGYAVEIVEGAERRLVLVELGFYADSWVEVTNGAVTAGEMVVVAR